MFQAPNTFSSPRFEYSLQADTTTLYDGSRSSVPVTYLNTHEWISFRIQSRKTKLRHNENIYFSLKLEFASPELDQVDWLLWDKWAQAQTRPRAIEIEPHPTVTPIYDAHDANQAGFVANQIDQLSLRIRFNASSAHFPPTNPPTSPQQSPTVFRLVIQSYSDESGAKFDTVSCLLKLFEASGAQKAFQMDQYNLMKNYVEILNPEKNTSVKMVNFEKNAPERTVERSLGSSIYPVTPSMNDLTVNPNPNYPKCQSAKESSKITINIFYLYLHDHNFTSMPFPLSINCAAMSSALLRDKLFLPFVQKQTANQNIVLENLYFRELKNAYTAKKAFLVTDSSVPTLFKHNCGYKLELEPINNKRKCHSPKKVLHELSNCKLIGHQLEKCAKSGRALYENLIPGRPGAEVKMNLHIIECFLL